MANIHKLKPKDILYEVTGRGNRKSYFPIVVESIDLTRGVIHGYWNNNKTLTSYPLHRIKKLRTKEPNF